MRRGRATYEQQYRELLHQRSKTDALPNDDGPKSCSSYGTVPEAVVPKRQSTKNSGWLVSYRSLAQGRREMHVVLFNAASPRSDLSVAS